MAASTTSTARSTRTRKAAEPKFGTTEVTISTTPVEVEETTVSEPTAQPVVETAEVVEAPKAYLATKSPTDLHVDFAEWLLEQTGVEVDLKTVQIVCVLRDAYQRSDRNQASLDSRKAAAAARKSQRDAEARKAKAERLVKLAAELGVEIPAA